MMLLSEHHRVFRLKRWVYNKLETPTRSEAPASGTSSYSSPPSLENKLGEFEMKYGETTYRAVIQAQAKHLMSAAGEHATQIVDDSVKRYMVHYERHKAEFIQTSHRLEKAYDDAVRQIELKTKDELSILKDSLKDAERLTKVEKAPLPDVNDKHEVNRHFENHLKALNDHYFKDKISEGNKWNYRSEYGIFQSNVNLWVQTRLNEIRDKKGDSQQYEAFKQEVKGRYVKYANFDGHPSSISSIDLRILNARMKPSNERMADLLKKADAPVGSADYNEFAQRLEDFRLMNPEAWKRIVLTMGENIIQRAYHDRVEERFIAKVSANIEKIDAKTDRRAFKKAQKAFKKHLETVSQKSVQEALGFIQEFSKSVFDPILTPEKTLADEDPAFANKVSFYMDELLDGRFTPEKPTDKALVEFMQSDRKGREKTLLNPASKQKLMLAISEATSKENGYPKFYEEEFSSVKSDSTDPIPFRLKALIVLGEQAKSIVANYSTRTAQKIEAMKPQGVTVSLKFKPTLQNVPNFQPAIVRGGFNGRDLALKGLKWMGALAMLTNFAQGMSENKSETNLLKRIALGAKSAIQNPSFLVGFGALTLGYKAEEDPRFLKYPWLSPYEQDDVLVANNLRGLTKSVGSKSLDRFVGNPAEWKLAKKLAEEPEKLRELMEKSKVGIRGISSRITPDRLVEAEILDKNQDADIYRLLNRNDDRTRFLFYQTFLQKENVNIHDLKEHVTGSSFII